jgi:hypothetical protein
MIRASYHERQLFSGGTFKFAVWEVDYGWDGYSGRRVDTVSFPLTFVA